MDVTMTAINGTLRGIFLDCEINQKVKGGKTRTVSLKKSTSPVHDDLRKLFKQLVPHFAFICEEIPKDSDLLIAIEDSSKLTDSYALFDVLANYEVLKYSIVNEGNADKEGVVLTGTKTLKSKETISIEAPAIKWADNYEFMPYLQEVIGLIREETELYWNGKEAPDRQIDMFAQPQAAHTYVPGQDADFDDQEVAAAEPKKRKPRKNKNQDADPDQAQDTDQIED